MDHESYKIIDVNGVDSKEAQADIVREEPLRIIVNDKEFATVMRTPGSDRELTVGFLFSEGLIDSIEDIQMLDVKGPGTVDTENVSYIKLKGDINSAASGRAYEVRSSCGVCGKKKIDALLYDKRNINGSLRVKLKDMYKMPGMMAGRQELSSRTRGAHSAAFFTLDASLMACFEDVGRHNALDKLIGHSLLSGIRMDDKVLLLSGRTSFEMMAKAYRCRIPIVAAISAPSSLAIDIAKRTGMALSGILRGDTMKIYNGFDVFVN